MSRSRNTRTSMPAVNARPPPVRTATRVTRSAATASKAARTAWTRPGSRRLSGGRSSVHQAAPPARSTLRGASDTLVAAHGRINRPRPVIETAEEVLHVLEAELAEVVGDRRAPHALVAIDDDLVLGVQLVCPELDLLDRDVHRVLEAAEPRLPVLTHVEQQGPVVPQEPRLQRLRREGVHRDLLSAGRGPPDEEVHEPAVHGLGLLDLGEMPARVHPAHRRAGEAFGDLRAV